ncbi:unnamed protein product [Phytomonas sp. EM1]|nr:unnamed protein product [Phytomonas sp. EM1]|eukprot:CCW60296.1 unnamed protein product [Phytomonas sp. isolate EM1]
MLSRTFCYLRRKGRRLPKSLASLTAPNLKRSWRNLHGLTAAEKEEIVHGSWRQAMPVQLVSDVDDRDRGGFVEPLSFPSDEAAADFLHQETEDDKLEPQIPTLELAQQFFEDLAATASEELSMESGDGVLSGSEEDTEVPTYKSDETRRGEQLDAHRQFFVDYYVQQGLISEMERHAFVAAMLRPAIALFQVNGERPLSRLVVRDQLERHVECSTEKVFQRTYDPLIYSVVLTPTQLDWEESSAMCVARGSIPPQEDAPPLIPPKQADLSLSSSADVAVCMSSPPLAADGDSGDAKSPEDTTRLPQEAVAPVHTPGEVGNLPGNVEREGWCDDVVPLLPQPTVLPSIAHLHWLQRQVATGILTSVDILTPILSRVAVGLASATSDATRRVGVGVGPPSIILDMFGARTASSRVKGSIPLVSSSYHRDVASYARMRTQPLSPSSPAVVAAEDVDETLPRGGGLDSVVVVAALSQNRRPRATHRDDKPPPLGESTPQEDGLITKSSHPISLSDQAPNLAFIHPPDDFSRVLPCAQLLRSCRVVLFTPPTTEDGVRPRLDLGADIAEGGEAKAAPNHFIDLCQRVNSNFERLQRQLRAALRYVEVGGWLLYATHSLNPLENEGVVCALLTALRRADSGSPKGGELDGGRLRVECVPLHVAAVVQAVAADEREAFTRWIGLGERGVASWVALEGAPAEQEVAWCDPAIVAEVSAAAWRSNPLRTGFDGGFVILLRVCEGSMPMPLPESLSPSTGSKVEERKRTSPGSATHLPGEGGQELKLWQHPASREFFAMTPSLAEWCASFTKSPQREGKPQTASSAQTWKLAVAGVSIGCAVSTSDEEVKRRGAVLSAAAAWDEQVAASLSRRHARGCQADVPYCYPLCITLPMLCELLRLGKLTSRELEYWVRQRRRRQPSEDPNIEANCIAKEEEINAFLHSVRDLLDGFHDDNCTANNALELQGSMHHIDVLLSLSLPRLRSAGGADVEYVLHEAVMQELTAVGVVATLTFSKPMSSNRTPDSEGDAFSLELLVPDAIQDQDLHLEAIREMSVALRDALLYVLRRMKYPHTISLSPDRTSEPAVASPTSMPLDVVKLQEDEYEELEAAGPNSASLMLSFGEVRRRERRLRALRRKLNEHGIQMDGSSSNDWMRTLPYARRGQRSRREVKG